MQSEATIKVSSLTNNSASLPHTTTACTARERLQKMGLMPNMCACNVCTYVCVQTLSTAVSKLYRPSFPLSVSRVPTKGVRCRCILHTLRCVAYLAPSSSLRRPPFSEIPKIDQKKPTELDTAATECAQSTQSAPLLLHVCVCAKATTTATLPYHHHHHQPPNSTHR